jgi:hypothetical protein
MQTTYVSDKQREVVETTDARKLLCGCAGSRKTDTLVRIAIKAARERKNVLILTLVGSVTREICGRLSASLQLHPSRRGNHFVWNTADGACVEVANYDAMVNTQLVKHPSYRNKLIFEGDCFSQKVADLYTQFVEPGQHDALYMVTGDKAQVLLMDEFQDLHPVKVRILTHMIRKSGIEAVAAGDYLQTIFDHALQDGDDHPMDIWMRDLDARRFFMDVCFRCPAPHVRLANRLTARHRERYSLPAMLHHKTADEFRPIVFRHQAVSRNNSGYSIACQIVASLRVSKTHYPDIVPSDVAVLMSKSNDNVVFAQLEKLLADLYLEWGFTDAVKVFATRTPTQHISINWDEAVGRTVMLSIHGDKGRDHRVVFFVGCSERAIPSWDRVHKPQELIDISLLNVAITRSTQLLFVGFADAAPSRYLMIPDLEEYASLSWNPESWRTPFCRDACAAIELELCSRTQAPNMSGYGYIDEATVGPRKALARVRDDVASMFEHPRVLAWDFPWRESKKTSFGRPFEPTLAPGRQAIIFGYMGELLFQREYCLLKGRSSELHDIFGMLIDETRVIRTSSDQLLNIAHDLRYNTWLWSAKGNALAFACIRGTLMCHIETKLNPRQKSCPELQRVVRALLAADHAMYIVHSQLADPRTTQHLVEFLAPGKPTPECMWHAAIAYMALHEDVRTVSLWDELDRHSECFESLRFNAETLAKMLESSDGRFQQAHSLIVNESNPHTLTEMGYAESTSVALGIVGVADFETDEAIYEFKCPLSGKYNNQWVLQPLVYNCISKRTSYKNLHVVDLCNGVIHEFKNTDSICRHKVVRQLLLALKHRDEHVTALLSMVQQST